MTLGEIYNLFKIHFLVDTDTRKIRKNTIFFALKGGNFNGNAFAKEALEKGAMYSIVDEQEYANDDRIILVENTLTTLQQLAGYHRDKLKIPIVALTGSNGKTTTKELVNAVLSKKFKTTATIGNLNNHIGVPLTLLSMTKDTEIGIVEMGANHPKEIEFLSNIANPDYGYITNFGKAHLEGFGSLEGVVKAKSELYDYLMTNNKIIFVNNDDAIQMDKTKKAKRVMFDDSIELLEVNPFVRLSFNNKTIQSSLIGNYNFNNIAAAITIGRYFGVSDENIKLAIENYEPNNNRSQVIQTACNSVVLDAYNANPTSMEAAITSFKQTKAGSKTIILGDMFELGDASLTEHQKIVDIVSVLGFQNVFLVGENFCRTTTKLHQFRTLSELEKHLEIYPIKNNHILIKGSRGMALERVLEAI